MKMCQTGFVFQDIQETTITEFFKKLLQIYHIHEFATSINVKTKCKEFSEKF